MLGWDIHEPFCVSVWVVDGDIDWHVHLDSRDTDRGQI